MGSRTAPSSHIDRFIDLHMHSTASDGGYAPARLMEMAHARGLAAVALTDHDTTGGLAEASHRAAALGLEFVSGIELEAAHHTGVMHLLGYFIRPESDALVDCASRAADARAERNAAILGKLAARGIALAPEELGGRDSRTVGRPHIADALVRRGVVRDFRAAFDEYLAEGGRAHVPLRLATAESIVEVIRAAGGVATLAHPVRLRTQSSLELRTLVKRLRDVGLGGIEVWHPSHSPEKVRQYLALSVELGLCATGGSDFHRLPPKLEHGVGFGRVRVSYDVLDALKARHASM